MYPAVSAQIIHPINTKRLTRFGKALGFILIHDDTV